MKLFVVGFPKSGTTTLTAALEASGLRPAHWANKVGTFIGRIIYDNVAAGRDPFARLEDDFDAITQADVCLPAYAINYWPNLDFEMLATIRAAHPECLMLLNTRDPHKICASIDRWPSLRDRMVGSDIPGLPVGVGAKDEELIEWIENHYAACRNFFADDPNFLELDIEDEEAPRILERALGIDIKHWGIIEPQAPRPDDIQRMAFPTDPKPGKFRAGPAAFQKRERPPQTS